MKRNNTFISFHTILFFTIASLVLASCSGTRYSYFNKKKVPHAAPEETKLAKAIPANPFLAQSEKELKEKTSVAQDKKSKRKNVADNTDRKKTGPPITPGKVLKEINIAKYIPQKNNSTQSENETDRTLMIVLLVVLILLVIALLGDDLLWLLFLALLIVLIYFLVKHLGIFN